VRATRATVPYFFWVSVLALVVLVGLDLPWVRDAVDPLMSLWIVFPALLICFGSLIFVTNGWSFAEIVHRGDPSYQIAAKRARVIQGCLCAVLVAAILTRYLVPNLKANFDFPFPATLVLLYASYIGYFPVVRRFG
jgi:hypothetical protein